MADRTVLKPGRAEANRRKRPQRRPGGRKEVALAAAHHDLAGKSRTTSALSDDHFEEDDRHNDDQRYPQRGVDAGGKGRRCWHQDGEGVHGAPLPVLVVVLIRLDSSRVESRQVAVRATTPASGVWRSQRFRMGHRQSRRLAKPAAGRPIRQTQHWYGGRSPLQQPIRTPIESDGDVPHRGKSADEKRYRQGGEQAGKPRGAKRREEMTEAVPSAARGE